MNPTTEMALWLVCGGAIGLFLGIAILVGAVFILVNIDDRRRDRHQTLIERHDALREAARKSLDE